MKTFKIPVYWTESAEIDIEANSLEEAIEIVQYQYPNLPKEHEYIDGSFEVNEEVARELNDEYGYKGN